MYAHAKVPLVGDIPAFLRLEPLARASASSAAPTTLQLYLLKLLLELEAHDLLVLDMHDGVDLRRRLRLQVLLHTVDRTLDFLQIYTLRVGVGLGDRRRDLIRGFEWGGS